MLRFSLNIRGKLYEYTRPVVMGILNITPDSFYGTSRAETETEIRDKALSMIDEGVDIIDVGAYSTRPGHQDISVEEEARRLRLGIGVVRELTHSIPISVDTFRADVARIAIDELGADIINDISGGNEDMYRLVAELHVPYILTHNRDINCKDKTSDFPACVISDLAKTVSHLGLMGVNDIIVDPGFGFGKSLDENYKMLAVLDTFSILHLPILVGISRKSMITKLLDIDSEEALPGTDALNTVALMKGASILRVHDVKAALQVIKCTSKVIDNK